MAGAEHVPVLYEETIEGLGPQSGELYVDCTAGSGGHSAGILEASAPDGELLALDADSEAVERTRIRLQPYGRRARVKQGNFRDLEQIVRQAGWEQVDGVLFDLGVSSVQLGVAERGFSFQLDGPLDMRMDPSRGPSAAELVNTLAETDLETIFRDYGEEPLARRIATAIVRERATGRIETTARLADLVARAKGRRGRIHPATTVFQALRIAVNGELDSVTLALPQAMRLLRPGGRMAVIAFHSLEDRIVKRYLHQEAKECRCPPQQPVCSCNRQPLLRLVNRHAIVAGDAEVLGNPRARSARLRIAVRL